MMSVQHYDVPGVKLGSSFLNTLGDELQEVWEQKWKYEHFIVFQIVILQREHHVSGAQAILHRIVKRLDAW